MLTINLIVCYFIFTSINLNQLVSSRLYYPKYKVWDYVTPVDTPKPVRLTDTEGGSSVYFESSIDDKPLIKLPQACVIVVQSPPGQGLILHPIALDINQFDGKIVIYQLHLSAKDSHVIYNLDDTFDPNDDHLTKSVNLNTLPGDQEVNVLFEFHLNSNQSDWNKLAFKFLITSFLPVTQLGHCPEAFYFDCGSGRCIRQSLHCDGVSNCADGFDEHDCALAAHEIFLIALGISIMLIIVVGLIWYVHRKESKEFSVTQIMETELTKKNLDNTKV